MKYYAVKQGKQPGIYDNWEDCRAQVAGYSGADFKSFETQEAAQDYLQKEVKQQLIDCSLPFAFIDGTFSKNNNCYGWGGFIKAGDDCRIIQGTGDKPEFVSERNIAGELCGTLEVMRYCLQNHVQSVNIVHDYAGIDCYVSGQWQAKTPLAKHYLRGMDFCKAHGIATHFIHVDGHTGIKGN